MHVAPDPAFVCNIDSAVISHMKVNAGQQDRVIQGLTELTAPPTGGGGGVRTAITSTRAA